MELAVGKTRSPLSKRIRPSVRSRMATPITPSSLSVMSRTRASSFFHSKSLPESVRVVSAFCWPKAFVANTRAMANAESHMCRFSPQHLRRVERDFGVQRRLALRHDRKYPRGEPRSAFWFGKSDDGQRSGFGNLIKIREQLDLVMVRAQDVSLQRVIFFSRGEPRIGIGGFVARCGDLSILIKIFQHRQTPAGIMRNTVCIFVFHFCGVRPAFRPIGAHRHERAGGNLAMIFLPLFHPVEG